MDALVVGVQVAVVLLDVREQPRGLVDEVVQGGLRAAGELPAGRLERLVHVGVGERQAAEVAVRAARDAAQVVEVAALLDVGDAVRERDVAVDALPRAELARGIERDVVERQRAQPRSAPGAGRHRARASGPVAPRPDRALQATHGGDVALLHEAVLLFGREAENDCLSANSETLFRHSTHNLEPGSRGYLHQ